jgi:hypothetical protein
LVNLRLVAVLVAMISLIGLSGCRTAPIRDYNNQPVPQGVSLDEISKAIQDAGNSLGWAMKEEYPGKITGTLYIRRHIAKVEIPYSRSSYSIRYVDSSNLKYDAEKRTIHSNYDGWVQNLDHQIRARLGSL